MDYSSPVRHLSFAGCVFVPLVCSFVFLLRLYPPSTPFHALVPSPYLRFLWPPIVLPKGKKKKPKKIAVSARYRSVSNDVVFRHAVCLLHVQLVSRNGKSNVMPAIAFAFASPSPTVLYNCPFHSLLRLRAENLSCMPILSFSCASNHVFI